MKSPLRELRDLPRLLNGAVAYVWEDVAPGLAITSLDKQPGRRDYNVTHTLTGGRIGGYFTRREARRFAQQIAPLTTWHRRRSIEGFKRDEALRRAVAKAWEIARAGAGDASRRPSGYGPSR